MLRCFICKAEVLLALTHFKLVLAHWSYWKHSTRPPTSLFNQALLRQALPHLHLIRAQHDWVLVPLSFLNNLSLLQMHLLHLRSNIMDINIFLRTLPRLFKLKMLVLVVLRYVSVVYGPVIVFEVVLDIFNLKSNILWTSQMPVVWIMAISSRLQAVRILSIAEVATLHKSLVVAHYLRILAINLLDSFKVGQLLIWKFGRSLVSAKVVIWRCGVSPWLGITSLVHHYVYELLEVPIVVFVPLLFFFHLVWADCLLYDELSLALLIVVIFELRCLGAKMKTPDVAIFFILESCFFCVEVIFNRDWTQGPWLSLLLNLWFRIRCQFLAWVDQWNWHVSQVAKARSPTLFLGRLNPGLYTFRPFSK